MRIDDLRMTAEDLLLAQIKAYLVLAKVLKSQYYIARAKQTAELYYAERQNRTGAFPFAA